MMSRIGESLGTKNQRIAAVGFTLLGGAGVAAGLAASGELEATASKPAVREVVKPHPDKVSRRTGQICINGVLYNVVHGQKEPIPGWVCNVAAGEVTGPASISENTTRGMVTSGDATINQPQFSLTPGTPHSADRGIAIEINGSTVLKTSNPNWVDESCDYSSPDNYSCGIDFKNGSSTDVIETTAPNDPGVSIRN